MGNDLNSIFSSLINSLNQGSTVQVEETVKSFLSAFSSGNTDTNKAGELLDTINRSVKNGAYSKDQIGQTIKTITNTLSQEVNSGKYSVDEIGKTGRKMLDNLGTKISSETAKLSDRELGNKLKEYINTTNNNYRRLSNAELGERLSNNISKYTDKIRNNTLTIDELNEATVGRTSSSLVSNTTTDKSTSTSKSSSKKKTSNKKKSKKKGSAIAKTTKKTQKKLSKKVNKKTKTKNKKLTGKVALLSTSDNNLTKLKNVNIKETAQFKLSAVTEITIMFDHDQARSRANIIQECCSYIDRDNKELQNVLGDIHNFWRGSLEERFVNQIEGYIQLNNAYKENLLDSYEQLQNGSKAYNSFDDYFTSKEI